MNKIIAESEKKMYKIDKGLFPDNPIKIVMVCYYK